MDSGMREVECAGFRLSIPLSFRCRLPEKFAASILTNFFTLKNGRMFLERQPSRLLRRARHWQMQSLTRKCKRLKNDGVSVWCLAVEVAGSSLPSGSTRDCCDAPGIGRCK